jgi:hypothetical protein
MALSGVGSSIPCRRLSKSGSWFTGLINSYSWPPFFLGAMGGMSIVPGRVYDDAGVDLGVLNEAEAVEVDADDELCCCGLMVMYSSVSTDGVGLSRCEDCAIRLPPLFDFSRLPSGLMTW